jgi:hypothetical protein
VEQGKDGSEWAWEINGRDYRVLQSGESFIPYEVGRVWLAGIVPTLNEAVEQIIDHVTTTARE